MDISLNEQSQPSRTYPYLGEYVGADKYLFVEPNVGVKLNNPNKGSLRTNLDETSVVLMPTGSIVTFTQ